MLDWHCFFHYLYLMYLNQESINFIIPIHFYYTFLRWHALNNQKAREAKTVKCKETSAKYNSKNSFLYHTISLHLKVHYPLGPACWSNCIVYVCNSVIKTSVWVPRNLLGTVFVTLVPFNSFHCLQENIVEWKQLSKLPLGAHSQRLLSWAKEAIASAIQSRDLCLEEENVKSEIKW